MIASPRTNRLTWIPLPSSGMDLGRPRATPAGTDERIGHLWLATYRLAHRPATTDLNETFAL